MHCSTRNTRLIHIKITLVFHVKQHHYSPIFKKFMFHMKHFSIPLNMIFKKYEIKYTHQKNILERKCLYYCINQCSTWKKYQIISLRLARCVPHGKNYRIQPTLILIAKLHSTLIMPTIENYCSTWEIIFKSIVRTHAKMCSIWNIRNMNTHWIKKPSESQEEDVYTANHEVNSWLIWKK